MQKFKKRKTILLLSDFFNDTSGVANMSKQIILGTCDQFNWIQLGCKPGSDHPLSQVKEGQIIDYSKQIQTNLKVEDPYVYVCISKDYGTLQKIDQIIDLFQNKIQQNRRVKIDAIMHFTDPRFWIWLYAGQRKLRQKRPLIYYNVWDNLPYPQWNKGYYLSCDAIANMSKQTQNIVKNVCGDKCPITEYIPLGVNSNNYKPLRNSDNHKLQAYRSIFGPRKMDFVVFYNNRNITRKHTSDIIMGYKMFVDSLPEENRKYVSLIMKTDIVDMAGTDLDKINNQILNNNYNLKVISQKISRQHLNVLYNIADVTVSLSSAQGFGLTTCQSLMAGTPIIAPVTGGLQDQMRFEDQNGEWINFTEDFPTNVYKKYQKHGNWCIPIYTDCQSTAGSPMTPYIWQSYSDYNTLAQALLKMYNLTQKQRKQMGLNGRQWVISKQSGMSHLEMCNRFIKFLTKAIDQFKPRKSYQIIKCTNEEQLKYKGLYNKLLKEWS